MGKLNRRSLFGGALGLGAVATLAACSGKPAGGSSALPSPEELLYSFTGEHQAGIITPAQEHLHFAAFDLAPEASREDLQDLLVRWTAAARRLVLGGEVSAKGAFGGGANFPPDDSGEAYGMGPNGLTLTFGFGRSLFDERFGLQGKLPEDFTDLPVMVNDFLNQERSHGDLCIQACAHDPQVATHAIRNLTRMAVGTATLRWSQLGFGRTSSTSTSQETPRNLFGQKDGTRNLKAEEPELLDEHVWISEGWARGGSYLTARRIAMTIEVWDTLQLREQERVTGRDKAEGAPLTGSREFDEPDFSARTERGLPVIDERSHVFRTHPDNNGGVRMLRRGYNFVDGNDDQGRLNAGLFFIAFTKTPERFARVHTNMARDDLFVEYLKTTNTGLYLVPPGVGEEGFVGEGLFTA